MEGDVFDFPGEEGNENDLVPSREAHIALREAFKSLKERYTELVQQFTELQTKMKVRERRGSHSRVYQERDELHNLVQKSYIAFKEKYGENEQLKKIIQELKENLRMTQEGLPKTEGNASRPGSTSEEEKASETKKYKTIIKELQTLGLEVIEDKEKLFIILTERDYLRKWMEEKSDGNIVVKFKGTHFEDTTTETEGLLMKNEQGETETKKMQAEIIQLKKKIQDQADELARFYKVFKEAMEQNLRYTKQEKARAEGAKQGLSDLAKKQASVDKNEWRPKQTSSAKAESLLAAVRTQAAEVKQAKHHVDKQNKSLRTLVDLTEKITKDFTQLVTSSKPQEASGSPGENESSQGAVGGVLSMSQGQGTGEETFERVFDGDAPLSIPVQETELDRLRNSKAKAKLEFSSGAMYNPRLITRETIASPASPGRTVPMATGVSDSTWTGESDIEVIEEEEDFVGAGLPRGKICPVCDRFFPESFSQRDFEMHVNEHFDHNT